MSVAVVAFALVAALSEAAVAAAAADDAAAAAAAEFPAEAMSLKLNFMQATPAANPRASSGPPI